MDGVKEGLQMVCVTKDEQRQNETKTDDLQ